LKILIFNSLFNEELKGSFKSIKKLKVYINDLKLNKYINKLKKEKDEIPEIELISYHNTKIHFNGVKNQTLLADCRHNLTHSEYFDIVKKVKATTKQININFLNNLKKLKAFQIGGIEIGDLLEIHLIRFFNPYIGEIELVKTLINSKYYDKVLFYNCNPYFLKFFMGLNKNKRKIMIYNDTFSVFADKSFRILHFFNFLLRKISQSLHKKKYMFHISEKRPSVILVANSKNHLNSIRPVYKQLRKNPLIDPSIYAQKFYLAILTLLKYSKFMIHVLASWKYYLEKICENMGIAKNLMEFFREKELYILLTMVFNEFQHLDKYFRKKKPSAVTISNELRLESKLITKFCKMKDIPTIYIPHAGVPIEGEVVSKKDFTYLTLWGEYDTNYYLNLGMEKKNLVVTGNPRFESFFNSKIKKLKEIKDMFSDKVYKFNTNKKTIILATSPFDRASIEKLIKVVVNTLRDLNLIENLIIKIHPRDTGLLHKEITSRLNVNPVIVRDYNILELTNSCDILISCQSSVILETMIIGKPIILAEFVNLGFMYIEPYAFTSKDFVKVAENEETLKIFLMKLIENQAEFLNYSEDLKEKSKIFSFYDKKEPPTQKIINLILNIVKEKEGYT